MNYYLNERNKIMCKKKDPNKKGFFKEFKEFITRGNVLDLAVGVIIGGAFTAIVTALTGGILQPIINWIISAIAGKDGLEAARTILGQPVYHWVETIQEVEGNPEAVFVKEIDWAKTNYIDWGAFITAVINFLLVALILFIIIKIVNNVQRKALEAKAKLLEKKEEPKPEEEKAE